MTYVMGGISRGGFRHLLFLFAFIPDLIFKISFLLLTLRFSISSFSIALGVELGYLFDFFLVS